METKRGLSVFFLRLECLNANLLKIDFLRYGEDFSNNQNIALLLGLQNYVDKFRVSSNDNYNEESSFWPHFILRKKLLEKIQKIAVTYNEKQEELVDSLYQEFKEDLSKWDAFIDTNLISIRFEAPDVLFAQGSDTIRPKFQEILNDFFPRYISILTDSIFIGAIEEVRIEGHTSSEWEIDYTKEDISYIKNMKLSQDRTRSILKHVLNINQIQSQKEWLMKSITQ